MITIITEDDKVFYSSFANLQEFEQADLDEGLLSLSELKYLLKAIESKRLRTDPTSLAILQSTIISRTSNGGSGSGGGLDPSLLLSKEDKTNKTDSIGTGSSVLYPTTKAVISYVTGATTSFITSASLTPYAFKTSFQQLEQTKADKITLNDYALKSSLNSKVDVTTFNTQLATKADVLTPLARPISPRVVNAVPLFTLDGRGGYVLCSPDDWVHIGNNLYIPAYNGNVLGLS